MSSPPATAGAGATAAKSATSSSVLPPPKRKKRVYDPATAPPLPDSLDPSLPPAVLALNKRDVRKSAAYQKPVSKDDAALLEQLQKEKEERLREKEVALAAAKKAQQEAAMRTAIARQTWQNQQQSTWTQEQWERHRIENAQKAADEAAQKELDDEIRLFLAAPIEVAQRFLPPPSAVEKLKIQDEEMMLAEIEEFFFEWEEAERVKKQAREAEEARKRTLFLKKRGADDNPLGGNVPSFSGKTYTFTPVAPGDSPERIAAQLKKIKTGGEDDFFDSDEDLDTVLADAERGTAVHLGQARHQLNYERYKFKRQQEAAMREDRKQSQAWKTFSSPRELEQWLQQQEQ